MLRVKLGIAGIAAVGFLLSAAPPTLAQSRAIAARGDAPRAQKTGAAATAPPTAATKSTPRKTVQLPNFELGLDPSAIARLFAPGEAAPPRGTGAERSPAQPSRKAASFDNDDDASRARTRASLFKAQRAAAKAKQTQPPASAQAPGRFVRDQAIALCAGPECSLAPPTTSSEAGGAEFRLTGYKTLPPNPACSAIVPMQRVAQFLLVRNAGTLPKRVIIRSGVMNSARGRLTESSEATLKDSRILSSGVGWAAILQPGESKSIELQVDCLNGEPDKILMAVNVSEVRSDAK